MHKFASICIILLVTLVIQVSIGMSAVMFPVKLDAIGFNKMQIGTLLALEIFAIVAIGGFVSRVISAMGMFKVLLLATLIRSGVIYLLADMENFWGWLACLFFYGMATNVFLIAMQTWLGALGMVRFAGLIIGLYSAILSAGVALGPWVLGQTGLISELSFQVAFVLCAITIIPFIFGVFLLPKMRESGKPRILYSIKNAPIVMGSAFVGGITFFGLPAFSTLFGLQSGLAPEQAAYLISAFMLGAIFVGFTLGFLSDYFSTRKLTVVCVFIGLVCSVYFPLAIRHYQTALALLFVWGGVMAGIYAMGLKVVNSTFRKEDLVSANVAYGLMDAFGGVIGIFLIGLAMEAWSAEGLSYIIVTAGVIYFIFVLSKKQVHQFAPGNELARSGH